MKMISIVKFHPFYDLIIGFIYIYSKEHDDLFVECISFIQGCVITRSREKAIDVWRMDQANNWYILETNYDHWENPLFLDDRRTPAHKCMQKTTSKVCIHIPYRICHKAILFSVQIHVQNDYLSIYNVNKIYVQMKFDINILTKCFSLTIWIS